MSLLLECADCAGHLAPDMRRCPFCRRTLATQRCEGCGERNLVLARTCAGCASPLPDRSAPGLAETTCPVCDTPLSVHEVHGLRMHECEACNGVFLDHACFARATLDGEVRASLHFRGSLGPYRGGVSVDDASRETPSARSRFYRRCPACRTLMSRVNFARRSAVLVDVCPRHGTWFDRDELLRALSFVERGGLEEARERERQEREEERAKMRDSAAAVRFETAATPYGMPVSPFGAGAHAWARLVELLMELLGWER